MEIAIVVLGIALVASLAYNFGFIGHKHVAPAAGPSTGASPSLRPSGDDAATRASKAEAELDKKRKELEDLKKAHADVKDELKGAKKKLFDSSQGDKDEDDLKKARAEVERQASVQLENTRHELAAALDKVQKLKADAEGKGKKERRPEPVREAAPPPPPPQRVIRELSDAEKEKMNRLEQQSASDKKKALELAAELRSVKAKVEREKREAKRVYEEGRLARDKFRAVEIRLNRTLLENDIYKRALADLEKKTGLHAEKAAPTAEDFAAADASMKARHAAEDKAADDAQKKLEEAEAKALEAEHQAADAAAKAAEAASKAAEAEVKAVQAEEKVAEAATSAADTATKAAEAAVAPAEATAAAPTTPV